MPIGISTYAFFWHLSESVEKPYSLDDVLQRSAELGVDLVQICDYAPLAEMDGAQLAAIRQRADALGLRLEVGTKGVRPEHLQNHLRICEALDSRILRTMLKVPDHQPSIEEATQILTDLLPSFERADVTVAIETYEQVPTPDIVRLVETIDHPRIGICSDPSNTIAILETPKQVIDLVAPRVTNMHIKDFEFTRRTGSIGFQLTGAPLGTGLLDYDYMVDAIRPADNNLSQVLEHWLPWQADEATTLAAEDDWNSIGIAFLKQRTAAERVAR